jgi:hypothetical protein
VAVNALATAANGNLVAAGDFTMAGTAAAVPRRLAVAVLSGRFAR